MARLNNRCHPDELRDFVEHGSHDPEEFPFLEEQSVLRRLEATLFSLRNWSVTKSKAALNNWHVRDFVLITQGDLLNTQDCYKLLQVIKIKPMTTDCVSAEYRLVFNTYILCTLDILFPSNHNIHKSSYGHCF